MTIFVTTLHLLVCVLLIILVLLQKGKGAEIGAVFGGASASTIFGSAGAGTFLTKLTTWSAVVFMVTSFYLAYVALNAEGAAKFTAPPPGSEAPAAAPAASERAADDFVEVTREPAAQDAAPVAPTAEPQAAQTEQSKPASESSDTPQ